MGIEPAISLHDVGARLAQIRGTRERVAAGTLLSLLKSGQLKAGFQFPSLPATVTWVTIPNDYWATVSNDKFRMIRYSSENRRSGVFKVRIGDFADVIAPSMLDGAKGNLPAKLKAILSATTRSYEVEIKESEWEAYRQNQPVMDAKGKSGRHQKQEWRDVCVIIGAYLMNYLMNYQQKTSKPLKPEHAAEAIFRHCKAAGMEHPPAAATIRDVLSNIQARSTTIGKQIDSSPTGADE
jgi:hypothetical protein